jgi:hypothetical protein
MRVPFPESSATEPSGFQMITSAVSLSRRDHLEDPVGADAEVVVADALHSLRRQRDR